MTDLSKVDMLDLLVELEKRGTFQTIIQTKPDGKHVLAAVLPLETITLTNNEIKKEEE